MIMKKKPNCLDCGNQIDAKQNATRTYCATCREKKIKNKSFKINKV